MLFLHGFGNSHPERDSIAVEFRARVPELLVRSYHPDGDWRKTRLPAFLDELRAEASERPFTAIVGFSVGGLIAALFQDRWPELVSRVILLAPAVDNYERNFQHVPESKWFMPAAYVMELAALPARPRLKVPALLIHGRLDTDGGGGRSGAFRSGRRRSGSSASSIRTQGTQAWTSSAVAAQAGTNSLRGR